MHVIIILLLVVSSYGFLYRGQLKCPYTRKNIIESLSHARSLALNISTEPMQMVEGKTHIETYTILKHTQTQTQTHTLQLELMKLNLV